MAIKNPYNMDLKTASAEGAVFKPVAFTPSIVDFTPMERAFARQEERLNNTAERRANLDLKLADVESKLHQDEETLNWFNAYKDNINKQIDDAVAIGDIATAMQTATSLAGKMVNDNELIGRIKTNEEYTAMKNKVAGRINNGISRETYDWWEKNNPYNFSDYAIRDDNGNLTSWNEVNVSGPLDDIVWSEWSALAFNFVKPDSKQTGGTSKIKEGEFEGGKKHSTSYKEQVTNEEIQTVLNALLSSPDGYMKLRQSFEVALHTKEKLKQQRDAAPEGSDEWHKLDKQLTEYENRLAGPNGTLSNDEQGYEAYAVRMIYGNKFTEALAYTKTTSDSTITDEGRRGSSDTGGGIGDGYGRPLHPKGSWFGQYILSDTRLPLIDDARFYNFSFDTKQKQEQEQK